LSASATELPPNFITRRPMAGSSSPVAGVLASGGS
jgi:hypothetical protein